MGLIVQLGDGSEPMNCTVVSDHDGRAVVLVDGESVELAVQQTGPQQYRVGSEGRAHRMYGLPRNDGFELLDGSIVMQVDVQDERDSWLGDGTGAGSAGGIKAQMPGKVISLFVVEGEAVRMGQRLLSIEAMKMENEVICPCDGVVQSVHVVSGANVEAGEKLIVIGDPVDE